jgi:hypothetical protein
MLEESILIKKINLVFRTVGERTSKMVLDLAIKIFKRADENSL